MHAKLVRHGSCAFACLVITTGFEKGVRESDIVDMVHCRVLENILVNEEKYLGRTQRDAGGTNAQ